VTKPGKRGRGTCRLAVAVTLNIAVLFWYAR
jgi:hypothetical protein